MPEAFEPSVYLTGNRSVGVEEPIKHVANGTSLAADAQIFHRHELGDREAVMHLGQADLVARAGDAGFLIGLLGGDARGVKIAAVPAAALLQFLHDVKAGRKRVTAPLYSHLVYDRVAGEERVVESPDILIVEGLNVLQPARLPRDGTAIPFVSDFFDFSIYIDAPEALIERWYIDRFMTLRETVFTDTKSYFHRYASLTDAEARETAQRIWREINYVNLKENVEPTRERAHFILEKGEDHDMAGVRLRKL